MDEMQSQADDEMDKIQSHITISICVCQVTQTVRTGSRHITGRLKVSGEGEGVRVRG